MNHLVMKYNDLQNKENKYRAEIDWKKLRCDPDDINQDHLTKLQVIDSSIKAKSFFQKMKDAFQNLDMYHLDFINSYLDDIKDDHDFILDIIPYYFEVPKDEWTGMTEKEKYNLKILFKWRPTGGHNQHIGNDGMVNKIYDDLKLKIRDMVPMIGFISHDVGPGEFDGLSLTFRLI